MTTVVVWNIETYGAGVASRGDYTGINVYIVELLASLNADVLVIEELKPDGARLLGELAARLSDKTRVEWVFDFIEGAIEGTGPGKVELSWGSNTEGYGVLAKTGSLVPLKDGMSHGFDSGMSVERFMRLAEQGAKPEIRPEDVAVIVPPDSLPEDRAECVDLGFPTSGSGAISAIPKQKSARLGIDYEARYKEQVAAVMRATYARRPCVLNVLPEGAAKPVGLVVYHSPVADPASLYAAMLCGLIYDVITVKENPNLIVGGDFNLVGAELRKTGFENLMTFKLEPLGGLDERSTVHYDKGAGGILNHARDQIFSRGVTVAGGGVYNIPVMDISDSDFNKAILGSGEIAAMVEGNPPTGYTDGVADIYEKLKNSFKTKTFDSELSAAMLFRGYISDHLPLVIKFSV